MSAVTERTRATRRLANEFPNRVRPSKFAHVVLTTPNLPRARQWYLNTFDARVAYENDTVCFLTYDDEHHRIGLIAMPNLVERPPNSFGLEHMAYSFQTLGLCCRNIIFEVPGDHTLLDDQSRPDDFILLSRSGR